MIRKIQALLLGLMLSMSAMADEGMWLPMLLNNNYAEMQRLGLKLTPEQIYSVNNHSLKDAIGWFNGGCTSEIISEQGLLLTNHHCGYDAITKHSTPADNILDNGFWAKTLSEEKPNPGMWVSILVRMEDVSDKVLAGLKGVEDKDLDAKRAELFKAIETEATANTHYNATVKAMFKGNAYYLFVFEKFTDIRLVGTPPQSLGKFGGDTDNWVWPRHTADFSMFRIYANKDNKPAAYSAENVPYKPKKFLSISLNGIKEGDYAMVYGFPGRTNRYETSYGVKLAVEKVNPTIVALRDMRLKNWKQEMDKSDSVRILLSSKYAQIANYWKYFIGQTEQLKRLKVYDTKIKQENGFNAWAADKPEFNNVFSDYKKAYADYEPYALHRTYFGEGVMGASLVAHMSGFIALEKVLKAEPRNEEEIKKTVEGLKVATEDFFKWFNKPSEERILAASARMYYENVPVNQQPEYMAELVKKYKGKTNQETFEKMAAAIFKKKFVC